MYIMYKNYKNNLEIRKINHAITIRSFESKVYLAETDLFSSQSHVFAEFKNVSDAEYAIKLIHENSDKKVVDISIWQFE